MRAIACKTISITSKELSDATMPDEEKQETKPIRFVFPRGLSAEEIHKAIREMLDKHKQAGKPAEGDGGETRK
jgi:hypothetical protein